MAGNNELITVGQILNTQGIKGEVKVRSLTDYPERFQAGSRFVFDKNGQTQTLTLEIVRQHNNFLIIKFREIQDMDSAEALKNGELKITKDQLVRLPEDTYFIFEILDMEVRTEEGLILGRIKDVVKTGSNDVYVVAGENKDYLIPALKNIVINVDKTNKLMIIKPLEGLLEL